jgi:putative transposase
LVSPPASSGTSPGGRQGAFGTLAASIPSAFDLQAYLKSHERYVDLHSQSSQRILAELAEAFESWYGHRGNGNEKANPPGYRKHNDEHPRSTVTFKQKGFKHDAANNRLRLSKGSNLKDGWSDFILCEYDAIGPRRTTVENVQQVRAVYEHGVWRLHIVCRVEVDVAEPPGDRTAGVDLGICNVAAVSFGDESLLYPGGALKEDEYYFDQHRAKCDDSASREARRLDRKRTDRRTHFFHTLSKEIVAQCAERGVGTVFVGDLGGIREDEDGPKNWGRHGNLDLHGWAFDRLTTMVTYKAEMQGIAVETVSERDTSKTCSVCGAKADSQRVERGLYDCDECGTVANADCNGAENIRQKSTSESIEDRSNGWLAQPAVRLFDAAEGRFLPQGQATREP